MIKTKIVKKPSGKGKVIESGGLIPVKEPKNVSQVDNITNRRILTVHGLAALLQEGKSLTDCSKIFNVSRQACHQFAERNIDRLSALCDTDSVLSYKLLNTVHSILDSIDDRDCKKAGLQSKLTAIGIAIDKSRLLTDRSTANIQSLSHIISSADSEFLASLGINKPDQT